MVGLIQPLTYSALQLSAARRVAHLIAFSSPPSPCAPTAPKEVQDPQRRTGCSTLLGSWLLAPTGFQGYRNQEIWYFGEVGYCAAHHDCGSWYLLSLRLNIASGCCGLPALPRAIPNVHA